MSLLTERRLQLLSNGYAIIPTRGKQALLKGWNTPEFASRELHEKRVTGWPDRWPDLVSTGVRIERGLRALDIDVDDGNIVDALMEHIATIAPEVHARAPARFGGGEFKRTLFVRAPEGDETFTAFTSHKYLRPGDAKGISHKIELFGGGAARNGNCARHCGVYGPHSYHDDGKVAREYRWDPEVAELYKVRLSDLPEMDKSQMFAIAERFEALAGAAGWKRVERLDNGGGPVVYDIDKNTRFDTSYSNRIDYEALCAEYEAVGDGLRCSSNFMKGRGESGKRNRCLIGSDNRHGCVMVFVPGDDVAHFPKELAPVVDNIEEALQKLRQILPPVPPPRPADGDDIPAKALWLGFNYGYCALSDSVIELFEPSDECQLKPPAFQRLYRAWREAIKSKKGAIKYCYATSYWEVNPARLDIRGVRMRPDMPFPLYEEGGHKFKNTYLRPQHQGHGDIKPWLDFMAHLLPDVREREWFCNWLAHKHLHPGVPGVAVVMVAVGAEGPIYGAGRGILRDIIARLLGPKYVKPIDFDIFTGKSSQGIYTDWGAFATMVTVNEAKDTPESGRWTERRAVYERLREIVDPRAIERTFIRKGQVAFSGLSFASYLVFSNNRDALQIPDGDRRIAALANGVQMASIMADGLQKWMQAPENIAELARWLENRDLSGFDAYAPPLTETKTVMQELARSELDEAFETIRRRIGPKRLFTGDQIRNYVLIEMGEMSASEATKNGITRRLRAEATRVGFQMPPAAGRHHILHWRGQDSSWVLDVSRAQEAVGQTARLLSRDLSSVSAGWNASTSADDKI